MAEFFQAGGVSMWFVTLFGLLTLGAAVYLTVRPHERHVGTIRALSGATTFVILMGLFLNLSAVMYNVSGRDEWAHSPDVHLIVMTGIGESLTTPVLGFGLLAVAWLVTAVGVRRLGLSAA